MNLIELHRLTSWIQTEIVEAGIPQKYAELQAVLQRNSQNQPNEPFEVQKEDLLESIRTVRLSVLTKDQISFLADLGLATIIGQEGVNQIENILFRNAIDTATAVSKIGEITGILGEGIRKSTQISEGLKGCIFDEETTSSQEVLIRVSFLREASMSNIKDFKKWGAHWYDIGRGITMAHGSAPENIRITGAAKGSVILELMADPKIATTIAGVIWGALKLAEKVLDITKKAAEVRQLNLQNTELADGLERAATDEKTSGISSIVNIQIENLNLTTDNDSEKIAFLEKSVEKLVNFISQGGEVDFVIPEEEVDGIDGKEEITNSELVELRTAFEEIKTLENKIKLLEKCNDND